MHEFGVAKALVEHVIEEAEKNKATSVLEVIVEVGELSFIGTDQFSFAYEVITKEIDLLRNSKLTLIKIDAEISCESCGFVGPLEKIDEPSTHFITPMFACPKCFGKVNINKGKECTIKNIRMTVD